MKDLATSHAIVFMRMLAREPPCEHLVCAQRNRRLTLSCMPKNHQDVVTKVELWLLSHRWLDAAGVSGTCQGLAGSRRFLEARTAMKTRAKPTPAGPEAAAPAKSRVPPQDPDPPKLFIVPKALSPAASIVTLAHPRTLAPSRFFFCPDTGIHELKHVAASRSACRSILLSPAAESEHAVRAGGDDGSLVPPDPNVASKGMSVADGYVLQTAELFIATPIDPLFLVLPALSPQPDASARGEPSKTYFLSADDLLDRLAEYSKHLRLVLQNETLRASIEARMAIACDTVEAGDETMYRLSETKLLKEILGKAHRVVKQGLPPSLEDKFVTRALQRPLAADVEEEKALAPADEAEEQDTDSIATPALQRGESQAESTADSQASNTAVTAVASALANTGVSTPPPEASRPTASAPPDIDPNIPHLLRLRTAIQLVLSSYIPAHLASVLLATLASPTSPVDFAPLDAHLAELARLRSEAAAARAMSNSSRKRTIEEEEEREEKRQRKEALAEEERTKKKAEPKGLKALKKVDTSGMKKMSDFFKKKS